MPDRIEFRTGAAMPRLIRLHEANGWQRSIAIDASRIADIKSRYSVYTMSGHKTIVTMNDGTVYVVRESVGTVAEAAA